MLAEFGEDLVDRIGDADAALDRDRAPSHRANLGAQRLGFVGAVVVVRRDVAARCGELQRDRAADAARGAGDERDFSGQRPLTWWESCCVAGRPAPGRAPRGQNSYFTPTVRTAGARAPGADQALRLERPVLLHAVPDIGGPETA